MCSASPTWSTRLCRAHDAWQNHRSASARWLRLPLLECGSDPLNAGVAHACKRNRACSRGPAGQQAQRGRRWLAGPAGPSPIICASTHDAMSAFASTGMAAGAPGPAAPPPPPRETAQVRLTALRAAAAHLPALPQPIAAATSLRARGEAERAPLLTWPAGANQLQRPGGPQPHPAAPAACASAQPAAGAAAAEPLARQPAPSVLRRRRRWRRCHQSTAPNNDAEGP